MGQTKANASQVNQPLPLAPYPWVVPALASGWTVFDTGPIPNTSGSDTWRYPRYHKDSLGYVHLDGLVLNNSGSTKTSGNLILTLPAGFLPGHTITMSSIGNDVLARIDIKVSGQVTISGTTSVPNGGWVSLNNIHFLAEQ